MTITPEQLAWIQKQPGYQQLPKGIACRVCPCFRENFGVHGERSIRVHCGSFFIGGSGIVTLTPDPRVKGEAWVSDGNCWSSQCYAP